MKKIEIEELSNKIKESDYLPQFLTDAHKENYLKGMKQIKEWKESPSTLKEILERQRKREM